MRGDRGRRLVERREVQLRRQVHAEPGHQLARRRPVRRVLRQTAAQQRRQLLRHAREVGLVMDDLVRDEVRALRIERAAPGRRVHQHRAQREHIGGRSHFARPLELFGCHERRRPDQFAGFRPHFAVGRSGNAEIDDFRAVGGQQDIARFQIAVHHARTVDVAQRLRQTGAQFPYLVRSQRAVPFHMGGKRGARNVERRHPRALPVGIGVHDRRGECAAHPARGRHLLPEPAAELRVLREFRVHHLHREPQPGRGTRQVHHAHAARPEQLFQPVVPRVFRMFRFRSGAGTPQRRHLPTPVYSAAQTAADATLGA